MALDPTAKAVVEMLEQTFPRIEDLSAAEARRLAAEMPRPTAEPEPVARVENRTIPGPAGELPVRIYWPDAGAGPLPVIAFFHGGGFVICDLDSHDGTCRMLANGTGSVVVSVDYRLAPEHKYPAAAEDCYAATCWVAANAAELGADPSRLVVAGDSAGGNLAAVTALMARDKGGPPIAFQLLVYPVIDHNFDRPSYTENAEGYFLRRTSMEWYWDQYLPSGDAGAEPYASPIRARDLSALPPAFIVTAEHDPLRDEGEAYGERLQASGVAATARRYDGMFHGFFGMGAVLDGAKQANQDAFAAVREAVAR